MADGHPGLLDPGPPVVALPRARSHAHVPTLPRVVMEQSVVDCRLPQNRIAVWGPITMAGLVFVFN